MLGLGNPGARYAHTRHNAGWLVLDALAERWRARPGERTSTYEARVAAPNGVDVTLLKPLTFMNASGEALAAFRERQAVPDADLLVVTDDVYLPLGAVRARAEGGAGGHRGLESIEQAIGSGDYPRLRLGVGAPAAAEGLREHVLETFSEDERTALDDMIRRGADAVECWVGEGILATMNRYNRRESPEEQTS